MNVENYSERVHIARTHELASEWKVCKCLFLTSPVLIDISFGHISCKMVSVLATYHHIATHAGLRLSVRENFDVDVTLWRRCDRKFHEQS